MKSETVGGCLLLTVFGLLWLGWAFLVLIGLLLESDGIGSWNAWIWLVLIIPTFIVAPALLWWGFIAVIRLGDEP